MDVLLQEDARARQAAMVRGTRRRFMWKATSTSALLVVNSVQENEAASQNRCRAGAH